MKILDAQDIFSFSVKVGEQITQKNLLNFIRTSIKNSEYSTSKQTFFSFYFNKNMKIYDILLYDKVSSKTLIEPLLYLYKYDHVSTKTQVYYTKTYFTIVSDETIILFKKFNATLKEDIEIYIKQIYKIKDFEIFYLSDKEIIRLKESVIDKNILDREFKEYPLYQENSFFYFITFLSLSPLIFLGILYLQSPNKTSITQKILAKKPTVQIKSHIKPINKMVELFEYIHSNKIQIKRIVYSQKKIKTLLMSTNKQNILDFINIYKRDLTIKSLKYDKAKNIYTLEVTVGV